MKIHFLIALVLALLPSCKTTTPKPDIVVSNRDASGKFISPTCPVCQSEVKSSATVYHCRLGHTYRTEFAPK